MRTSRRERASGGFGRRFVFLKKKTSWLLWGYNFANDVSLLRVTSPWEDFIVSHLSGQLLCSCGTVNRKHLLSSTEHKPQPTTQERLGS